MPTSGRQPYKTAKNSSRRPQIDVAEFRGQWVALHPETYKVIGHGASLEVARQSTPALARLEPVLYFVPKSDAFFVGLAG